MTNPGYYRMSWKENPCCLYPFKGEEKKPLIIIMSLRSSRQLCKAAHVPPSLWFASTAPSCSTPAPRWGASTMGICHFCPPHLGYFLKMTLSLEASLSTACLPRCFLFPAAGQLCLVEVQLGIFLCQSEQEHFPRHGAFRAVLRLCC